MRLTATDIYTYYQPSECALRVFLRNRGEPESEPSEYEKILRDLGNKYELNHLKTLGAFTDLSGGTLTERNSRTIEALKAEQNVLYQPALKTLLTIGSEECEIWGIPDLLIRERDNYIIRDCKISRHADEDRHYETILQVELYGLLYERTTGKPAARLEVLLGDGTLQPIPDDHGHSALDRLEVIHRIKKEIAEFYEPVGWSKCNGCGFFIRCWEKAKEADDLARVYGISQNLARVLHSMGVANVDDLISKFDASTLAEVKIPSGAREVRVGAAAEDAILHAKVLKRGNFVQIAKPQLPVSNNLVVFDIEGLPPQLDELDKIYLWGIQAFGEKPNSYLPSVADFGPDGDKDGWFSFLSNCEHILKDYGDIPFLHWHQYERIHLRKYVAKYGDRNGVAIRVDRNLVDLFPITRGAIVLPEPTYSLKVVEQYANFKRDLKEANGAWSMATYIKAVESEDADSGRALIGEIVKYNEEDLQGTWAVFQWLQGMK